MSAHSREDKTPIYAETVAAQGFDPGQRENGRHENAPASSPRSQPNRKPLAPRKHG